MIYYGEVINDLSFVSVLFIGDNSNSKSYIYYQDKVLQYEDTDLTKVNNERNYNEVFTDIVDKILRRLLNETDFKFITKELEDKIKKYVKDILDQGLGEDEKWHQKTKSLK